MQSLFSLYSNAFNYRAFYEMQATGDILHLTEKKDNFSSAYQKPEKTANRNCLTVTNKGIESWTILLR